MEHMLSLAIIGVSLLMMLVGEIWLLVRIWRTSGVVWFLLCLFIPIVALFWLLKNWQAGQAPVLVSLAGAALSYAAVAYVKPSLSKDMLSEFSVLDNEETTAPKRKARERRKAASDEASVTSSPVDGVAEARRDGMTSGPSFAASLHGFMRKIQAPTPSPTVLAKPTRAQGTSSLTLEQLVIDARNRSLGQSAAKSAATATPTPRPKLTKSEMIDISFEKTETSAPARTQ